VAAKAQIEPLKHYNTKEDLMDVLVIQLPKMDARLIEI